VSEQIFVFTEQQIHTFLTSMSSKQGVHVLPGDTRSL